MSVTETDGPVRGTGTVAIESVPLPPFRLEVRLWVCPDPRCGSYSGQSSSHDRDLTAVPNLESDLSHTQETKAGTPKVVGNRGECPACKARGVRRQRVPLAFVITVDPALEPVPPPHCVAGALLPVGVSPL